METVDTVGNTGTEPRIRENVARLLDVSAAQIEMAMYDGEKSLDGLTALFRDMFSLTAEVCAILGERKMDADTLALERLASLEVRSNRVLIGFQFFDLLRQRVSHGTHSVKMLSDYLMDEDIAVSEACWEDFRKLVNGSFSLEREKRLFELMMDGLSSQEALARLSNESDMDKKINVEFF